MTKPMARFLFQGDLAAGIEVDLSADESHHLARVLRIESGTSICLVNGEGKVAEAQVISAHPIKSRCQILSVHSEGKKSNIHLAFAIPKSTALDFIIHRCTEVGVASFQPLMTQHSLHVSAWNADRWNKIVFEVAKQCQETHFPKIYSPMTLQKWLETREASRTLVYCDEEDRLETLKLESESFGLDLLVGAEGGWSDEERECFKKIGVSFGLGKNRLRAETAAMVALTVLKKYSGEI